MRDSLLFLLITPGVLEFHPRHLVVVVVVVEDPWIIYICKSLVWGLDDLVFDPYTLHPDR